LTVGPFYARIVYVVSTHHPTVTLAREKVDVHCCRVALSL
jgi:hypothetical protein